MRRKELVPVAVEGAGSLRHWTTPETLEALPQPGDELTHILSPFDPLVRQRERTELFFGYKHLFEAYCPRRSVSMATSLYLCWSEIVSRLSSI